MTGLADEIAAALAGEPSGLSCATLAALLRRRPAAVRAVLDADPRFVQHGRSSGTRWRLATAAVPGGRRDERGRGKDERSRDPMPTPDSGAAPPVRALRTTYSAPVSPPTVRRLRRGEWPPDADMWLARDGQWRPTSTEPPHWPGEVIALQARDEDAAATG